MASIILQARQARSGQPQMQSCLTFTLTISISQRAKRHEVKTTAFVDCNMHPEFLSLGEFHCGTCILDIASFHHILVVDRRNRWNLRNRPIGIGIITRDRVLLASSCGPSLGSI